MIHRFAGLFCGGCQGIPFRLALGGVKKQPLQIGFPRLSLGTGSYFLLLGPSITSFIRTGSGFSGKSSAISSVLFVFAGLHELLTVVCSLRCS